MCSFDSTVRSPDSEENVGANPPSAEFIEEQRDAVLDLAEKADIDVWKGFPMPFPPMVYLAEDASPADLVSQARGAGASPIYMEYNEGESGAAILLAAYIRNGIAHTLFVATTKGAQTRWRSYLGGAFNELVSREEALGTETEDDSDWELSWSEKEYRQLPDEHRNLVDEIVADPTYDPWDRKDDALRDHTSQLSIDDYREIEKVARSQFHLKVGDELERQAGSKSVEIIQSSEFSPFLDEGELAKLVEQHTAGNDARLRSRVVREIRSRSWELMDAAQEGLVREADSLLDSLDAKTRDTFGFTARNKRKEAILGDLLPDDRSHREREELLRLIVRQEDERFARQRERRFATVARRFLAEGKAKSRTASNLGISTNVLDRLLREWPDDIDLDEEDYLRRINVT